MSARKLTPEETVWIRDMARVLRRCPDTLELRTIGDRLDVVDRALARSGDLHDGNADRRGAILASLPGPICHGVSG